MREVSSVSIEHFPERIQNWPPSYFDGRRQTGFFFPVAIDVGSQVTFNPDVRHLDEGDQGGPWLLTKDQTDCIFGHFQNSDPNYGYRGPTLPWSHNSSAVLPSIGELRTDSSYYSAGARAIAATEPSKSVFNGSTFLGETMSDGLPAMAGYHTWRDQTLRAKQAGGEYLNYQFGWVPFVSDLRDFAFAVKNSSDIVHNYRTHSNTKIRRSLELSDDATTSTVDSNEWIATAGSWNVGTTPTRYTMTLHERMWFKGCFTYYMPMDNSMASRFKRYKAYASKLLGVNLTPETVWNVAPWSWAVDWKTDCGAVIHNWSHLGHDGLVLQYGYLMHSQQSTLISDAGRYGQTYQTLARKRRVPANPYGFGVDVSGLSATQIAVLASLGVTRGNAQIIH
jgi:hypothetical protein